MAEKILIIDDDIDTLRLVSLVLQKQGYQIVTANNGEQGLLEMSKESPDLILLDVMMPEMDGHEVARRLRQDPSMANIPILMFTAQSQLRDKEAGFESGADAYLTKPTHPKELQAHIENLLAQSEKRERKEALPQEQHLPSLTDGQRKYTVGIISDRFSDWFTDLPDTEAER